MMTNYRKGLYLVLALSVILLASVLPGCGDSDKETTPPPAETPTDIPAEVPEENPPLPEEPASQDEPPAEEPPPEEPPPAQEEAKQITIIYVEDDNPVSTKEIWLSYYDENDLEWVTEQNITDEEGMATFNVPEGEAGESFTFTFAFSEAQVNEFTQDIEAGKRMGWRIPPDPLQTKLTLKVYDDLTVSIVDGAAQMWVP